MDKENLAKIKTELKVERAEELLKACYDLLQKQENSRYVLDLLTETIFYDDAECDGTCLMEDIGMFLDIKDE